MSPNPAAIGIAFPGQGSDLLDARVVALLGADSVTNLVEHAGRFMGIDLRRRIEQGDPMVARTEVAQPAIVAISLGMFRHASELEGPATFAFGHSLGELSAAAAAGCLSAELAVELATERGVLMAEAARHIEGAMVAVTADSLSQVQAWIAQISRAHPSGFLVIAGRNAARQWTLSGDTRSIEGLRQLTSALPVATDGAWHSPALLQAQQRWRERLSSIAFAPPRGAFVSQGMLLTRADAVSALLVEQFTEPFDFYKTVERVKAEGVQRWRICGPGRLLRRLLRDNLDSDADVELLAVPMASSSAQGAHA